MKSKENNCAYIDGANLYKGIAQLGWTLDYARFRRWLTEKYGVAHAYLFIGLIPRYKELYTYLQKAGFTLIFKEVVYDNAGKPKGNCDADLVLQAVCDAYENNYAKAVVVASDGDYACLVKFLEKKGRLKAILSPAVPAKCSILLKRTGARISYLNEQRSILEDSQEEKAPDGDGTP
jgi:uncharacterized LabA/DUF88 family protein